MMAGNSKWLDPQKDGILASQTVEGGEFTGGTKRSAEFCVALEDSFISAKESI